ncbi:MAG: sporulation protein [Peptostreptococcaceae bacterium]
MSIFKKVMASALGVGAAKVDTIVHTNNLMPGQSIQGVCKITGGNIEQYISDIKIGVYTSYKKEIDDSEITKIQRIQERTIKIEKNIQPGEIYEVGFNFILYKRVPITKHKSRVWLDTDLGIEKGVDTSDKDYINVEPNEQMQTVFNAISELGFSIREIENEHCPSKLNGYEFVQEFEFVPTSGYFRSRLDELELVFVPKQKYTDIVLEVDRKVRGIMSFLSEEMGLDESKLRFRLEDSNEYTVAEIKSIIDNMLRKSC